MTLNDKFQILRTQLQNSLVGRDTEVDAILIGLVAQEHLILQGTWGLAKSLLLRSLCNSIAYARPFEYCLNKDTDAADVFGHIDMEVMANERKWRPNTTYSALNAHFVLADEFFRGSSYIQNAFLGGMNERTVFYCNSVHRIPLRMLVAGSNTWPVGEGFNECGAIFDRFILRVPMKPVLQIDWPDLMDKELPPVQQVLTLQEVDQSFEEAKKLPLSKETKHARLEILEELHHNGIIFGDRRIRKSMLIARAAAWLDGSLEVLPIHLEPLKWVLWEDPIEHSKEAAGIILKIANPVGSEIQTILTEVAQILDGKVKDTAANMANIKKLEEQEKKAASLTSSGNGRAKKALQYIQQQRIKLFAKQMGISDEKAALIAGA